MTVVASTIVFAAIILWWSTMILGACIRKLDDYITDWAGMGGSNLPPDGQHS